MVLWEYRDEYSPEGLRGDGRRGTGLSYVSLHKKDSRISFVFVTGVGHVLHSDVHPRCQVQTSLIGFSFVTFTIGTLDRHFSVMKKEDGSDLVL